MAVLTGENTGAGRATDGVSTKGILKDGSARCQSVDVGSRGDFGEVAAVCRDGSQGVVVREEEKDIGLLGNGQSGRAKGEKGE